MKLSSTIVNLNDSKSLYNGIVKSILSKRHYIEEGKIDTPIFNDGETSPHFKSSVRGKRVYILSSPNTPIKREQLYLTIDAARRASAIEIIPIIPYMPYARQDKKDQYRGPIGARVFAEILEGRGATSIITFDLHSSQIVGFFKIPVNHLSGKYLFYDYILKTCNSNSVLCSPDAGGLKRVKKIRDLILKRHSSVKIPFISLDKTRSKANEVGEIEVLGDVKGRNVLIIDDMVDTGGTIIKGADALLKSGAHSVRVLVTHAVLSGDASDRLRDSNIDEFICSDSLIDVDAKNDMNGKLTVITTCDEIANAILSINSDDSLYK